MACSENSMARDGFICGRRRETGEAFGWEGKKELILKGPVYLAKRVHLLKLMVITYVIKARWYVQNHLWEDHSGSLLENGLEENKTRDKGII